MVLRSPENLLHVILTKDVITGDLDLLSYIDFLTAIVINCKAAFYIFRLTGHVCSLSEPMKTELIICKVIFIL